MKNHRVRLAILWLITAGALYYAFRLADWGKLLKTLGAADPVFITAGVGLTCLSYLFRSRRWQHLFPTDIIGFADSCRVLFLGFFMNNILPARAGEIVRAHMGSKVTGQTRTLVLATIAAERLADGLTLSVMFVLFAVGIGGERFSKGLFYVADFFGAATVCVALVLVFRGYFFKLFARLNSRLTGKAFDYAFNRMEIFINGLSPLFTRKKVVLLVLWSTLIWMIEMGAYIMIGSAFGVSMGLKYFILFLVAVNFSSLIPAAPGAIGVIEAVASTVLISVGVEREIALSMVVTQHVIQYLVVGIPGGILMFKWKEKKDRPIAEIAKR